MSKRERFRQHAAACLRLVEVVTAPETRKALICMAQRWYELADREPSEEFPAGYQTQDGPELLTGTGD
jgi:hypothetical protein